MRLRAIAGGMDPQTVADIDARLLAARQEHGVAIPLAVESGSRAWGFPSPDSDYDCRFVFVRPSDGYLTPWPRRDVIETPLDSVFDVNGWELGKAIRLLCNGNAVIIEWLTSPIIYDADPVFRAEFLGLAERTSSRERIARHYLHLGERQRRTYFSDEKSIAQKKIFYALRPAAALRWLRLHPDRSVAPMHFPTLLEECEPPPEVRTIVVDLIARKAVTRELGREPLVPAIARFIDLEFETAREMFVGKPPPLGEDIREQAERFFRTAVRRLESGPTA